MEIKCKECGWEGNWVDLKPIKHDGEHIPACPKCTGINFSEQLDLLDSEEEEDGEG